MTERTMLAEPELRLCGSLIEGGNVGSGAGKASRPQCLRALTLREPQSPTAANYLYLYSKVTKLFIIISHILPLKKTTAQRLTSRCTAAIIPPLLLWIACIEPRLQGLGEE